MDFKNQREGKSGDNGSMRPEKNYLTRSVQFLMISRAFGGGDD